MIKCNLAVIMAERGLKIVDLVNKTGISKTTIRALYHNNGKGVQFDTLEKICEFLDITPGDLFTYYKFTVKILKTIDSVSDSRQMVYFHCLFRDDEKEFTGTIGCLWDQEKDAFIIFIWNKLFNKLSKIPQRHMSNILIDQYDAYLDTRVTSAPEIALYDTDIDEWMDNANDLDELNKDS